LPPITVLACSDSRVPPELVFNQSLGTLFVVRTAGNVADEFGLASIEYAIANDYTKLIVVLGHENCGAVMASLGGGDAVTPALKALATRIRMSFVGIPYDPKDAANVRKAVEANTRASAAQLLAASSLIREAAGTGKVKIMTAYYDLHEGVVKKVE
jgi:carbonic anhydrase